MRRVISDFLEEQLFFPTLIALFINPFYFARKGLCNAVKNYSSSLHGSLLDVGCGKKPYERLFNVDSYRGLDVDSAATRENDIADDLYDGNKFPYKNEVFDSLLCNQVLEHVFEPDLFLMEMFRVLKPNGRLLLTVPFVWDEHEQPHDYARYSSFGLSALLSRNGFKILKQEKLGCDVTVIFQLINAYLFKITKNWHKSVRLIFTLTVMGFFNICGLILGKLLPKNSDLFLDQVILAEKIR